jgi:uncharacterized protein (TIGR02301 family)
MKRGLAATPAGALAGALAAIAIASALLCAGKAEAQGILDLFGPDRAERAPRPARKIPHVVEKPRAEAKAKKRDGGKRDLAKPENAPAKAGVQNADGPAAPYEPQLMRLSEVLGALAFLRDLCGAKDGNDWRDEMSALLNAEAPDGPRREKFIAAFNRGFRGYELTYRLCTPNAKAATARYLDEAARISRDVTYRFGSP